MGVLHKTKVLLWGESAETAAERKVWTFTPNQKHKTDLLIAC